MSNKNSGLSLIELMIVIAIIGILAAVAVPNYQTYILKAKLGGLMTAASATQLAVSEYVQTTGATNCSFMPGVDSDSRVFPFSSNLVAEVLVIPNCNVTVEGVASEFGGVSPFVHGNVNIGSSGISWNCTTNSDVNYAASTCPAEIPSS